MTFKHGHELTTEIRRVVSSRPAKIAVAYWGKDACEELQLPKNLTGYRVVCDAHSGFCSPIALGDLLCRKAKVVAVSRLHAKVYLSSSIMVVTSANASSRGLSRDMALACGLEAGMLVTNERDLIDADDWFDILFDSGTPIDFPDLLSIEVLWDRQRASRPLRNTLVGAILQNSENLSERKIEVFVYAADAPSAAIQELYKTTEYFDENKWKNQTSYPFFWGEGPQSWLIGDQLLCIEITRGKVVCEGVWKLLSKRGSGVNTVWPAEIVEYPLGQELGSKQQLRELSSRVSNAIRAKRLAADGEKTIPLAEFGDLLSTGSK